MAAKTPKKAAPKKGATSTTKTAPAKPAPKAKAPAKPEAPAQAAPPTAQRDPRLPAAGTILTRTFKGKEVKVEVLDHGFRLNGRVWRSLSAIAKEVTGTTWNGYLWAGLVKRVAKSTPVAKDGAK